MRKNTAGSCFQVCVPTSFCCTKRPQSQPRKCQMPTLHHNCRIHSGRLKRGRQVRHNRCNQPSSDGALDSVLFASSCRKLAPARGSRPVAFRDGLLNSAASPAPHSIDVGCVRRMGALPAGGGASSLHASVIPMSILCSGRTVPGCSPPSMLDLHLHPQGSSPRRF